MIGPFPIFGENMIELAYCSICLALATLVLIIFKFKGLKEKNNCNGSIKRANVSKDISDYQNQWNIDKFNYHKILNEFHNACKNCSNLFSSMKCIQWSSNYPELINIKMVSDGVTPFHRVCFRGNVPVIEFMLAKGADPEIKTVAGENALCMAIYYYLYSEEEDLNCLNILYKNGCRLSYDDEWYGLFLNLAIKNNNKSLAEWLITHSRVPKKNNCIRASSMPL